MKKYFGVCILVFTSLLTFAQPVKKNAGQKAPSQKEIDKMMDEATKDMSPEEKAEIKKMMGGIMPALMDQNAKTADYTEITSNKQLVIKKDIQKIGTIAKKKLTATDVGSYAGTLYNKIITKGDAAEIALIKSIIVKASTSAQLENAAVLCMLQGHPQAAIAIAAKSVQADPRNLNAQNNLASLLTQYGYPEQAIPLLNKLADDAPSNSTVLNNMAYAWLGLGDTDSARIYSGMAMRINPGHTEAMDCGGLMEELFGDPFKANEAYVKSLESNTNPFTEKLLSNNNGQGSIEKIDFNKIKKAIAIYEYFPKDWIKIPALSDNVNGYENDMRIKNSYEQMLETLDDKITAMQDAAGKELDNLQDKGEEEFVKTMANESIKGINMMSKSAVIVQKILQYYLKQWSEENGKQYMALQKDIEAKRKIRDKSGNNDKCPDYDRRNNEYLRYANPLIRAFHAQRIEEFRMWLNAFCTWSWYIVGNPKNAVLTQCIGWTNGLKGFYSDALSAQEAIAKGCVNQNSDGKMNVPMPEVPNFTCPAIVCIPTGSEWQQLSNTVKNFDKNNLNIKKAAEVKVPNTSIAYGADNNSIAQPGNSFSAKTADGSVTPSAVDVNQAMDNGLLNAMKRINAKNGTTPVPTAPAVNNAIDKRLTDMLKKINNKSKASADDELTPLPRLKDMLANDLLKKMMSSDCDDIKSSKDIFKKEMERMMKKVKELEAYEHVIEKIKEMEQKIAGQEALRKSLDKMMEEVNKMDKYEEMKERENNIQKIMEEMDQMDEKQFLKQDMAKVQQLVKEMENAPAVLKDIQQNGLRPSLSSGMQAPSAPAAGKNIFN
jgi:tetratricopeptide (TPR) repeat protein